MKKQYLVPFVLASFVFISTYSYGQKASKDNSQVNTADTLSGYTTPKHKVESKREADNKQAVDIDPVATPPKDAIIMEKKKIGMPK